MGNPCECEEYRKFKLFLEAAQLKGMSRQHESDAHRSVDVDHCGSPCTGQAHQGEGRMITRDDIALGWWRALPPYRVDMKAAWQLPEYSATNPPRRHRGQDVASSQQRT